MHAQTCVMRQLVGPRRRGWIPVQCWGIMVEGVSSTVVGGAGKVCVGKRVRDWDGDGTWRQIEI